MIAGRIGRWLATGLMAATAVNALAQPLAGCRMRAAEAEAPQTASPEQSSPEQSSAEQASTQQDDRPCHGRGAEIAVASGHETTPGGYAKPCAHAGSCTGCATGVCGGGHPALSIGSISRAAYARGAGTVRRIPSADVPRSVYHDPPLRPPATRTL